MREAAFIKQNHDRWEAFEDILKRQNPDPDQLADLFIQITDDLAFAQTQYPESKTTIYLNGLASKVHQDVYKTKKERKSRFVSFWKTELPLIIQANHTYFLFSFLIFGAAVSVGVLSAANDDTFVRFILGDQYVNMTLQNISDDDPMAVYKQMEETSMFLVITMNNIRVSFLAFVFGIFAPIGTPYLLFKNGVMLGAFQYLFYEQDLLLTSFLTIWIHGTLEISAIVIAGGAGMIMGNSFLFPGTFSRIVSFRKGAKSGMKVIVGLIPVFISAGFLEGFVTRHTEFPIFVKSGIILASALFIIYYFGIYPIIVSKRVRAKNHRI